MIAEVELGSVCQFENGDRGKNYPSQSAFVDVGIPFVNAGNLDNYSINQSELNYISEERYNLLGSGKLQPNDILFCLRGSLGKFAINSPAISGAIASSLVLLRAKDELDIDFLKHYLKSDRIKRLIKKSDNGSSQPNLSASNVKKFLIPLPPLPQQKKIATILDAADAYRQKTKSLIAKYDELTQSLFLDMFGDPVTNPKGWDVPTFKDVLEIRNGKNQKAIENENGIYPICGSGGVMSYGDEYISEANSVIIGRKGNINKPILMKEKYWHVDTAFGLNPIRSVLGYDYLYWFCVRYNFEQHNKTVTIPSLTKETLLRIQIPTPPLDLQNQFAARVQAIEEQKAQAQESLAKAEDLFNSLLQRAFKGELV